MALLQCKTTVNQPRNQENNERGKVELDHRPMQGNRLWNQNSKENKAAFSATTYNKKSVQFVGYGETQRPQKHATGIGNPPTHDFVLTLNITFCSIYHRCRYLMKTWAAQVVRLIILGVATETFTDRKSSHDFPIF